MMRRLWLISLLLCFMSGWGRVSAAAVDFALTQGWNLVTVPVNTESEITGFLSTRFLNGSGTADTSILSRIWNYDGAWASYTPAQGQASDLKLFKPNRGYWFYVTAPATLRLDSAEFSIKPLQLDRTGWAMVGFGNNSSLTFATEVLHQTYIDESHMPENIRKVWGYSSSGGWKSFQGGSTDETMKADPGMGYWFYVANHTVGETTYTVSESSPITITPPGASGEAALVIGGATELFPPDENKIAQAFRGKRVAAARYSTSVSTGDTTTSETSYCDESTVGKSVGYAEVYSLSGEKLNNELPSPVYCPSNPTTNPVSYAVNFSNTEKQALLANPTLMKDMVIKVKLASGAVQKAFVPSEIGSRINSGQTDFSNAVSTDTTSTLNTALVSLEMAKKLGVSPDRFKLGENKAGLAETKSEILELVSDSNPQIDITSFSATVAKAVNDENSPFKAIKDKIALANDPANIAVTDGGTFVSKADEIVDLLTGNRVPDYAKGGKTEAEIKAEMDRARSIASKASELLSSRKRAVLASGVLSTDEMAKLEGLAENIMKRDNEAEAQLADVLTRTVEVARSTRNDAALGGMTKANLSRVLENFDSSAAAKRTTEVMALVATAMDVPEEMVKTMAQNPDAARHFAGIVGTASVVLDKAKEEAPAELENLSRISSRLENSTQLIDVLVSNAPDSDTASEIVVGAVGSSASRTDSAQRIMDMVSAAKTALETSGRNVVIDMQDVAQKSVGRSGDLKAVARALAVGSSNASDAAKVLAAVASSVTVEDMKTVVSADKLKNEFSLNTRIVADAGRERRIRYTTGVDSSVNLDAGNTFDPLGETLRYRWYALNKTDNTTAEISSEISAWSTANVSVNVPASGLSGMELRRYRLDVSDANGTRTAQSEVQVTFFPELPPVVVAPQFVSAKRAVGFVLDASHSFDPETGAKGEELYYTWTLTGLEYSALEGSTLNSAVLKLSSNTPGLYTGVLEVKKSSSSTVSSTQEIRIRIEDELPSIADAGYGFVLTSAEAANGVRLDNFSYSMTSGKSVFDEGHGMTFEWTPRSYFSTNTGDDYVSANPLFRVTAPGTYEITLKVTDSGKTATDSLTILVKRGLPPVADAGFNSVLRLPTLGNATLTLDGSRSFSFAGSETYKWSGPVGLSSANDTQKKPVVSIGSGLFTQRTVLRYTLTVTDANGESTASKDVVVIPASQPPVIVIDQFPNRREFKPGEPVKLDASFSFSPNSGGSVQMFEWKLLSDFGSQTFDQNAMAISLTMPQVTTKTELKARLTITGNAGLSSSQDISFFVLPVEKPPVAVINPEFIILEDKTDPANRNKVLLSATRSFSNNGNPMSYRWDFSRRHFSQISGDLTSSVIELQAATGVADGIENITLYVTDLGNNLSAQTVAKAKLVAAVAEEPVMVDARFDQRFDMTLRRMVPAYDSVEEIYVFEKGEKVRAFGFAYDPAGAELAVTAELFRSNKTKAKFESIETITPTTIGSAGFVDFSLESAALTVVDTYCLLVMTIKGQETLMHMRVKPDKTAVTVRPKAVAFVDKISSSKGAVAYTQATTRIIDTYPDDFIEISMNGTKSTPAVTGSKLTYEWTYDWEVSDPTLKDSYPNIFINGADRDKASFMLPLSDTARVLLVKLTVTDSYTTIKSLVTTYRITASRKKAIPPMADAGVYQPIWVPLKEGNVVGDDPVVKLNGGASFSPVGNALSFKWESLSGLTITSANSRVATVAVPEGIHYFNLTVTDTVNKLVASATAQIEVKKEQPVEDAGVLYGIEAWADAYPIDVITGDDVNIHGQAWAFGLADSSLDITTGLIKTEVFLDGESMEIDSHGELDYTTSFAAPGRYKLQVKSWYDFANDDGNVDVFNKYVDGETPGDRSELFSREFSINVRREVKPVHFAMNFPAVYSLEGGIKTTAELNVNFDIIEEYQNDGLAWNFIYRYWIQSKDGNVSYDGAVIPSRSTTSELFNEFTADLLIGRSPLGVGEYNLDVELEAIAKDADNKELGRFYDHQFRNFRVESSELDLQLMVVDKTFNHETQTGVLDFGSLKLEIQGFSADSTEPMILQTIYAADSSVSDGIMTSSVPGFDQVLSDKKTAGTTVTMIRLYMETNGGVDNGGVEREKFYLDIPEKGVWNLDLVYDTKVVEVDGQYVKAGEFFSFSKGEVIKNRLDENDVFRADIDLIFNEDVYTPEGSNYATRTQFFSAVTGRNVVEVPPVDNDGNWVDNPRDFFDRALQQSGNVAFSHTLFTNSLSGRVYPWEGALYLVEYKRLDGSSNYALMLITMVDDFGFAFRFAKAVSTTPEIKFAGAAVQEMVRLNFDSERGEFVAVGGLPGTALKLMTSASKGYVVTSSQKAGRIVTADVWNRINIEPGVFAKDGSISGNVYFVKEQNPREGDWIMIDGYAYRTLTGAETVVSLPTPLYFHYREPIAFSMIWTEKLSGTGFKVYFEGTPDVTTLTPANFTLKATATVAVGMFENGVSVNISDIETTTLAEGYFSVTHDFSTSSYLAFAATDVVKAEDGKPVSRVRHVITSNVIWNNLVNPVAAGTALQEIFADDYGYTSQAYLVKQTDLGEGILAYEYNQWNPEDGWREFYAMKSGDDLSYAGEGSYDPWMSAYNYYFQPQDNEGEFNSLTGQSALTPVILLGVDWSVGSSYRTTFRVGSSYQYGNIYDENDYRAVRMAEVRVLRFLPEILQRGVTYKNVAEIELRSKEGFPEYDENGVLVKINFDYGETVIRRYLVADKLGVIRLEHTSVHEYSGQRNIWRNRRVAVGYMTEVESEVVRYVGADGNAALFGGTDSWTGFEFVDFRLVLDFPANMGGGYKVSVRQLNSATNDPVEVLSHSFNLPAETFPVPYESTFVLTSSTTYPYIFALLKADGDSFRELGRQERKIEGLRGYEEMFVQVPAEGDYATMRLFRNDGFSFAAGHHMWVEESKRDLAYVQKLNSNDFELVLNKYLPEEHKDSTGNLIPANRRIFTVTSVTGVDLKEKLEKILNSTAEITIQTGVSAIIPQAGNIYAYVGPNAERMKTGVGGEIVVLVAVTRRDLEGIDFLYTVKDYSGTTKVSFRNSPLLNSAGYVPFQHDFYAQRRIDASYRLVSATDGMPVTYYVDPVVMGLPWELGSGEPMPGSTPAFKVELNEIGYKLSKVDDDFSDVRLMPYAFDIWMMPTALNENLAASDLYTGAVYSDHRVFLTTDAQGNHLIMQIKPEFYDNTAVAGATGTAGAYYLEYIYLNDGDVDSLRKFWFDSYEGVIRPEEFLTRHELPYDFSLTGKLYEAPNITDKAMELVKDSFGNGFEVRPKNPDQLDLFRDARVRIDLEFMDDAATGRSVPEIYIMRDGIETLVQKPVNTSSDTDTYGLYVAKNVELGSTGYMGHFFANMEFREYNNRQEGDYVRIHKLHYLLAGSTEWLTISYSDRPIKFEYKLDSGTMPVIQANGLRLVGAEIRRDGTSNAYVEMLFNAPLAADSTMFAHLVRLKEFSYDNINTATVTGGEDDDSLQLNPVSLSIYSQDKRLLRAWFSSTDSDVVTEVSRVFELNIEAEAAVNGSRGIMDEEGRVLEYAWQMIGNRRIFAESLDYMPVSSDNEYFFDVYEEDPKNDLYRGEETMAAMSFDMNNGNVSISYNPFTSGDTFVNFTKVDNTVSYCPGTSLDHSNCLILWDNNSRLGQGRIANVDGVDYLVRFSGIENTILSGIPAPFPGSAEFRVEWKGDDGVLNDHRLVFIPNHGLGKLERERRVDWDRLGYGSLGLIGFKIANGADTFLQGGRGFASTDLNLTFNFAPSELFMPETADGYNIRFERKTSTGTMLALTFEAIEPDLGMVSSLRGQPFSTYGGYNHFSVRFTGLPMTERVIRVYITGQENDTSKTYDREIRLSEKDSQFHWFIDLNQQQANNGILLWNDDQYSLLRNQIDYDKWDITAVSEADTTGTGPSMMFMDTTTSGKYIMRISPDYEPYCDFDQALLSASTCNFSTYSVDVSDWQTRQLVNPGDVFLVHIPGELRQEATQASNSDVYALLRILGVNPERTAFSFEYALNANASTPAEPGMVNFGGAAVNVKDPEFTTSNYAPRFDAGFELLEGEGIKLSLTPWDEFGVADKEKVLVLSNPDVQVSVIELVATSEPVVQESGSTKQSFNARVVLSIPGGYGRSPMQMWDMERLPFALHQTLLPQSDSPQEFVVETAVAVEYSEYEGTHYCSVYNDSYTHNYDETTLIGKENQGQNNFLMTLNTYPMMDAVLLDAVNDFQSCTEAAGMNVYVNYRYFDHSGTVFELDDIPMAGDFAGTGKRHPLSLFNDVTGLQDYTGTDLSVMQARDAFSVFSVRAAEVVTVRSEEWDVNTMKIWIADPQEMYEKWSFIGSFAGTEPKVSGSYPSYSITVDGVRWFRTTTLGSSVSRMRLGDLSRFEWDLEKPAYIKIMPDVWDSMNPFGYNGFEMTHLDVCYPLSRICHGDVALSGKVLDFSQDGPTNPSEPYDTWGDPMPYRSQLVPSFRINSIRKEQGVGQFVVEFNRTPVDVTEADFAQITELPAFDQEGKFFIFRDLDFAQLARLRELTEAYAATSEDEMNGVTTIDWMDRLGTFHLDLAYVLTDWNAAGQVVEGLSWNTPVCADNCRQVTLTATSDLPAGNYTFFFLPMLTAIKEVADDYYGNRLFQNNIGLYVSEAGMELKMADFMTFYPGSRMLMREFEDMNFDSEGFMVPTSIMGGGSIMEIPAERMDGLGDVYFGEDSTVGWKYGIPQMLRDFPSAAAVSFPQMLVKRSRMTTDNNIIWEDEELMRFVVDDATGSIFDVETIEREDDGTFYKESETVYEYGPEFAPSKLLLPFMVSSMDYYNPNLTAFTDTELHIGDAVDFVSVLRDCYSTMTGTEECVFNQLEEVISYRGYLPELTVKFEMPDPQNQEQMIVTTRTFTDVVIIGRYGSEYEVVYDETNGWVRALEPRQEDVEEELMFFAKGFGYIMGLEDELEKWSSPEGARVVNYGHSQVIRAFSGFGEALDQSWDAGLLPGDGIMPSLNRILPPFSVEGIEVVDVAGTEELVLNLNRPVPPEVAADFAPATPAFATALQFAQSIEDLETEFGPGRYLIFKDLTLGELMSLHSLTPETDTFMADFGALFTELSTKLVSLASYYEVTGLPGMDGHQVVLEGLKANLGTEAVENLTLYFSPLLLVSADPGKLPIKELDFLKNGVIGFYDLISAGKNLYFNDFQPSGSLNELFWNYLDTPYVEELVNTELVNSMNLPEGSAIDGYYKRVMPYIDDASSVGILDFLTDGDRIMLEDYFGVGFDSGSCNSVNWNSTDCFSDFYLGEQPLVALADANLFKRFIVLGHEAEDTMSPSLDEVEVLLRHEGTGSWFSLGSFNREERDGIYTGGWHLERHLAKTIDGEYRKILVPLMVDAGSVRAGELPTMETMKAVGESWVIKNALPPHYIDTQTGTEFFKEAVETFTVLGYLPSVYIGSAEFLDVIAVRQTTAHRGLKQIGSIVEPDEHFIGDYRENIMFFARNAGPIFGMENERYPEWNEELQDMHVVEGGGGFIMNGYGYDNIAQWGDIW